MQIHNTTVNPNTILVIGYYNHDNLGDEQYKISFQYMFDTFLPNRSSYNIQYVDCDMLKVTTLSDNDIIILGGGDVLNEYFLDQITNKFQGKPNKIMAVSVGLPYSHILMNTTKLAIIDHIFIRTQQDLSLIKEYFCQERVHYLPDLSYYLIDKQVINTKNTNTNYAFQQVFDTIRHGYRYGAKYVVLSMNRHIYSSSLPEFYESIVDAFADFVFHIINNGYSIVFLPFNTSTTIADAYSNMENDLLFHSDLKQRVLNKYNQHNIDAKKMIMIDFTIGVEETMLLYKYFYISIPMRFHACLFSIYQNVPMIPVFTTKKIRNLMLDCEWKYSYELEKNAKDIPIRMDWQKLRTLFDQVSHRSAHSQMVEFLHNNCINNFQRNLANSVPKLMEAIVKPYPKIITLVGDKKRNVIQNLLLRLQTYAKSKNLQDFRFARDRETQEAMTMMVSFFLTNQMDSVYNHGLIDKMFRVSENPNDPLYNYEEEWKWIQKDYETNKASTKMISNPKGIFNLDFIDQVDRSGSHRSGWQYVYENIKHLHNENSELYLDLYLDRTFHWKREILKVIGVIPYTKPWMGFIHHTFDTTFSEYNNQNLLDCPEFIRSLSCCRCLFVLSKHMRTRFEKELRQRDINVPVYALVHPTEKDNVLKFTMQRFAENNDKKVVHVGGWLRNIYSFYQLSLPITCNYIKHTTMYNSNTFVNYICKVFSHKTIISDSIRKVALKGKTMNNYYPDENLNINNLFTPLCTINNKNCCQNSGEMKNNWYRHLIDDIKHIKTSVAIIDNLDNNDYDKILSENIVFVNLVDAAAVNTVIECVMRSTPIIVNRHPAVVELLGSQYPLFYGDDNGKTTNMFDLNKQVVSIIENPNSITDAHHYLENMDKSELCIESFVNKLIFYIFVANPHLDRNIINLYQ